MPHDHIDDQGWPSHTGIVGMVLQCKGLAQIALNFTNVLPWLGLGVVDDEAMEHVFGLSITSKKELDNAGPLTVGACTGEEHRQCEEWS